MSPRFLDSPRPTRENGRPGPRRSASVRLLHSAHDDQETAHISVVIDDVEAAIAFFTTLGMQREGEASVDGPWVDRVNGLEGVQVEIVMMRTRSAKVGLS